MWSIIAVSNKYTAKLHHVGSLYILTYDARKLKHKVHNFNLPSLNKHLIHYFSHTKSRCYTNTPTCYQTNLCKGVCLDHNHLHI